MIDHICDFFSFRFDQHLDRWQVIAALALALVIILFSLVGLVRSRWGGAPKVTVAANAASSRGSGAASATGSGASHSKAGDYVFVYVCGAVRQPGVYRTGAGTRVNIAVSLAGGLAENADATRVNLARRVVDGERIYIPRAGETIDPAPLDVSGDTPGASAGTASGSGDAGSSDGGGGAGSGAGAGNNNSSAQTRSPAWRSDGRLNLNLATASDLDLLPGIGPAFAARIIDYRQKHNGFTSIEQLGNVRGIGPKTLAKLKPLVCIE